MAQRGGRGLGGDACTAGQTFPNRRMPPPPCFAWSPSPRCARWRTKQTRSRGALLRPSYAHHHYAISKRFAPSNKKGGEAPKGAIQPLAAQHRQALPPIDARGAAARITEARPPSGASPRHSPGRTHPALAQPQNPVSRHLELAGILPAYILASVKRAPRRPVLVPVDRCHRAARGADRIHPRAGTALAPPTESALAKGALGERDGGDVTAMGTIVNALVTRQHYLSFPGRNATPCRHPHPHLRPGVVVSGTFFTRPDFSLTGRQPS